MGGALRGKVAVVTGASRGLGKGIAIGLGDPFETVRREHGRVSGHAFAIRDVADELGVPVPVV